MSREPADSMGIREAEWLAEMAKATSRDDPGMTVVEWSRRLKLGEVATRGRLMMARECGRLEVGRRSIVRLDGRQTMVAVYRVTAPKSNAGSRRAKGSRSAGRPARSGR